jgi:hypothetical protein
VTLDFDAVLSLSPADRGFDPVGMHLQGGAGFPPEII